MLKDMALLLSHADKTQHELLRLISPHYTQFAETRGWDILLDESEGSFDDRTSHWHKIRLLKELLPQYDFVLWVDCDFVLRGTDDPIDELSEDDFQGLVMQQDSGQSIGPNTGFWLLRNCDEAHRFLERAWETGPLPDAVLNDQSTVSHLLGFGYEPSPVKPLHGSEFLANTCWLNRRWNLLYAHSPEAPLTGWGIHYGGAHTMPLEYKLADITTQLRRDKLPGWEERLPLAVDMGVPVRNLKT
jgi:hypothetical protein